ncbi:MAG: DUF1015 domain-containing protein, partial [Candidatus Dormibacteraeota bacterium]|nr:DUF1015 domain-containing protein [Candidatus Dormibacteraeota bacterium]
MARLNPLRGLRYNPEHVKLGGVLAPPYDVITPDQQAALYGRNLRNIVRVDFGQELPGDEPGVNDRYIRAAGFLESWLELGVLVQDAEASLYVTEHEFADSVTGAPARRRGVIGTVAAVPWEQSELRPHERTLAAPKEDRLALLRALRVQTSPVFALWSDGGDVAAVLERVAQRPAAQGGRTDGEMGSEKHLLWAVSGADAEAVREALRGARLYVADGHHRYETAVAYAEERRRAEPHVPAGAAFEQCLVYLAAADDPALAILPTH